MTSVYVQTLAFLHPLPGIPATLIQNLHYLHKIYRWCWLVRVIGTACGLHCCCVMAVSTNEHLKYRLVWQTTNIAHNLKVTEEYIHKLYVWLRWTRNQNWKCIRAATHKYSFSLLLGIRSLEFLWLKICQMNVSPPAFAVFKLSTLFRLMTVNHTSKEIPILEWCSPFETVFHVKKASTQCRKRNIRQLKERNNRRALTADGKHQHIFPPFQLQIPNFEYPVQ